MRGLFSLILLSGLSLSPAAFAKATADLSKAKSKKVTFIAVGNPSALKIEGVGQDLSGSLTKDGAAFSGEAKLKIETIDTGMNLRNKHMKEKYLEAEKYPEAILKLKKLPWGPADDKDFAATEGPFEGDLTLHGVTKPVTGKAKVERANGVLTANVTFTTEIPDYKVEIPSFMGITVAKSVDVIVDVEVPVE